MRKNLPPLLTRDHTEADAPSLAPLLQPHSALSRGFVNGRSAFSPPFGPQFDLSRDGEPSAGERKDAQPDFSAHFRWRGGGGPAVELGKFVGDFPHKFLGF